MFVFRFIKRNITSDKSTIIPRPQTKRQHSSPANCGIAHINLSDVVAKITNGPKSCTNPFLNGSLSISEDTNSNEMSIQLNENQGKSTHVNQKNPFSRCHRHDGLSIFSFPSNGNLDESNGIATSIDSYAAKIDAIDTLIHMSDQYEKNFKKIQENHKLTDVESNLKAGDSIVGSSKYEAKNPFTIGNLHKTVSETYLEQYSLENIQTNSNNHSHNNTISRTLSRSSIPNLNAQNSININETELKRATSCDSVNSESSVLLSDLEQQNFPEVTGQICVGLQYDK